MGAKGRLYYLCVCCFRSPQQLFLWLTPCSRPWEISPMTQTRSSAFRRMLSEFISYFSNDVTSDCFTIYTQKSLASVKIVHLAWTSRNTGWPACTCDPRVTTCKLTNCLTDGDLELSCPLKWALSTDAKACVIDNHLILLFHGQVCCCCLSCVRAWQLFSVNDNIYVFQRVWGSGYIFSMFVHLISVNLCGLAVSSRHSYV